MNVCYFCNGRQEMQFPVILGQYSGINLSTEIIVLIRRQKDSIARNTVDNCKSRKKILMLTKFILAGFFSSEAMH